MVSRNPKLQLPEQETHHQSHTTTDHVEEQHAFFNGYPKNRNNAIANTEELYVDDATSKKLDVYNRKNGVSTKQKKIKSNSIISGKSIGEVSLSQDSLSREIVRIDSKDSETVGETNAANDCTDAPDQRDFDRSYLKNCNNTITNTDKVAVDNGVTKKTDLVTLERVCNLGETRASTKQRRKRKRDSITGETIRQYFGKTIGEASSSLGVSRSTLKRVCRELQIPSWPLPVRNKKYAHFGISVIVFLLVRVKRWSCSSNRHGFSARWWVCGRHNSFVTKSNPSIRGETIGGPLYVAQPLKESDDSIKNQMTQKNQVTVKASYKADMIKFQLPRSSTLLELKDQVAQRFKLNNTKFNLKYRDEDDDLILVACDSDFHDLVPFSTTSVTKITVRLIVHKAVD